MTMQQPIDGTVIQGVPDALDVSSPDLSHRRNLCALYLYKKRIQDFPLFFQGEILPSSASLAWRFNHRDTETAGSGKSPHEQSLWIHHNAGQSPRRAVARPEPCK
jgi:hypothetical protein